MSKKTNTTTVGAVRLVPGSIQSLGNGGFALTQPAVGFTQFAPKPANHPVFKMSSLTADAPALITVDVPVGTASVSIMPAGWPGSGCSPHLQVNLGEKSYDLIKEHNILYNPPGKIPPCSRASFVLLPNGNLICNSVAANVILPLNEYGVSEAFVFVTAETDTDVTLTIDLGDGKGPTKYDL